MKHPNDMSPEERWKYLRRWFPGMGRREFYKIGVGETINDSGFFASATIHVQSLQSGPKACDLQSGRFRVTASAQTFGRTTPRSAVKAVRRALVELHDELGCLLYRDKE